MSISTTVKNKIFRVRFNNRVDCNLYIIYRDDNIVCFWLIQSQSNPWLSSAKAIKEDSNVIRILFFEHFFKLFTSSICNYHVHFLQLLVILLYISILPYSPVLANRLIRSPISSRTRWKKAHFSSSVPSAIAGSSKPQ